jgi:hypothetical protein
MKEEGESDVDQVRHHSGERDSHVSSFETDQGADRHLAIVESGHFGARRASRSFNQGRLSKPFSILEGREAMRDESLAALDLPGNPNGEKAVGPTARRASVAVTSVARNRARPEDLFSPKRRNSAAVDGMTSTPELKLELASDEQFAQALDACDVALEGTINSTLRRVLDLVEGALQSKTVGEDLEDGLQEAFDGLLRNSKASAKELSEKDAAASRSSAKAAAKQFQTKLEHARTAANVSLKNKSVEMTATFEKKLNDKVQEMKEGGLLSAAQAKIDQLDKELQEEKVKHESTKATLEVSHKKARAADERRALAETQIEECKVTLHEALAGLRASKEAASKGAIAHSHEYRKIEETLNIAYKDLSFVQDEKKSLAVQIQDLVEHHVELQEQLGLREEELAAEKDNARTAVNAVRAEAGAEAQRVAAAHAEELERLQATAHGRSHQPVRHQQSSPSRWLSL